MARIAGVNIPTGKHLCIALTYIYGIGRTRAKKVLDATKIDPTRKVETLSEAELDLLRDELKKYIIEGDLRREVTSNIKILQEINSYRGIRHRKRLPVRGQRTKTNARTKRGRKGTVANKKK